MKYMITWEFSNLADVLLKLFQTDGAGIVVSATGNIFLYVNIGVYWKELNAVA
jgi:hypothetical protein